jgi:arylsulfatase A-like enzyme
MNHPADKRPNVFFIICDDLNNAISGMGRVPFAAAPNLKRLMSKGVRFTNAHNNCPICLPSRNSLLSGLYPHTSGHYMIWDQWLDHPLLRDSVMLPRHFLDNGYAVFGTGKVHHHGAGDEAWWTDFGVAPDLGPFPWDGSRAAHPNQKWLLDSDFLGDFCRRNGERDPWINNDRLSFPWEQGFGPLSDVPHFEADPEQGFPEYMGWRNNDGTPFRYVSDEDRDLLTDERSVNWAIETLRQDRDQPLFLAVGFMRPHTPLYAPRKFFDMFPPESLELPPFLEGDLDDCAHALVEHCPYGALRYKLIMQGGEAMWRKWLQAYLACVAFVDEQVGRLLDALDASPYGENCVVIFSSDNGYHMGEKEFLFKDTLWEESSQVPLIVSAPGATQKGGVCDRPVSLIDLYPTLTDLCNLPGDPNAGTHGHPLQGHSLRPLLEDPQNGGWSGPAVALTSSKERTGVHHAVRSATHRYILCENAEEELYDHRSDPYEWHNLAVESAHAEVKAELRRHMMRLRGAAL